MNSIYQYPRLLLYMLLSRLTVDTAILGTHGSVDILAVRAKKLDRIDSGRIYATAGDDGLSLAVNSGTDSEGRLFKSVGLQDTNHQSCQLTHGSDGGEKQRTMAWRPALVRMNRW
jgi:hypothetical protein